MVGGARLVLDVRCWTEGEREGGGGGKVGGGAVTSFVGAVVAGVGVGVVEEEGSEDRAAEYEVGVVCVPCLEGMGSASEYGGHCGWAGDFTGWRGRVWR